MTIKKLRGLEADRFRRFAHAHSHAHISDFLKPAKCMSRWGTAVNKTAAGRQSIVGKIVKALPSAVVFLAFLMLVTSVFSIVGMQFFAGKFHWPDGTSSRANFDNFYQVCVVSAL